MDVIYFILLITVQYGTCQVCNETRSITREVPETYLVTYTEPYEEPCVIFCSVKTRTAVKVSTRSVQHYENVNVNVCCDGYIEDDDQNSNGLYCKPVCDPECLNGFCIRPNECACKTGYALDHLDSHVCKPLCLKDCDIPNCISTKTPQCFANNTEPTPVCSEPCVNATCVATEACQCLPGYYKTSRNICEPRIAQDTSNLCHPGACDCDIGWQWNSATCHPVCSGCEFGTCIGPDECECDNGYVKSDGGKCKPHCSTGCPNGKCVSPEVCSCNPGWYMVNDGGECFPHCDMNCANGDCMAPNICICHSDYQLARIEENLKCIPIRKDCEDQTSTFDECKCEDAYVVTYSTDDGSDCDCFSNCSDLVRQCSTSFCVFKEDGVDTTPSELEEEAIRLPDLNVAPLLEQHALKNNLSSTKTLNQVSTISYILHPGFNKFKAIGAHWIYGITAVAVLLVILILGFVIKKKCCKTPISPDKNNDIIVHYTNTI